MFSFSRKRPAPDEEEDLRISRRLQMQRADALDKQLTIALNALVKIAAGEKSPATIAKNAMVQLQ